MSFARTIARSYCHHIWLVTARDGTGRECWFYIRVDPAKAARFEAAFDAPDITLTEYGVILEFGFGATPPPDIQEKMKREYFFEA